MNSRILKFILKYLSLCYPDGTVIFNIQRQGKKSGISGLENKSHIVILETYKKLSLRRSFGPGSFWTIVRNGSLKCVVLLHLAYFGPLFWWQSVSALSMLHLTRLWNEVDGNFNFGLLIMLSGYSIPLL